MEATSLTAKLTVTECDDLRMLITDIRQTLETASKKINDLLKGHNMNTKQGNEFFMSIQKLSYKIGQKPDMNDLAPSFNAIEGKIQQNHSD